MKAEEIKAKIEQALSGVPMRLVRESILIENPQDLPKVARFLKESPDFQMDYLSSITGADYLEYLESVYHLYSMQKKDLSIVLRTRVKRDQAKIPSLVSLYRGAEFQEREAFDMYGIIYEGHPDLRRIFMWEGFDGFPLRKDYQQEDSETLDIEDVEWLEKHDIHIPAQMRKKAEELKSEGKRAVAEQPTEGKPKTQ